MAKAILFLAVLALLSGQAHAGACYSLEELQAEQLLRLHSELMVIAVTCRRSTDGHDLVKAYGHFTQKNVKVIKAAEETLMAFYGDDKNAKGAKKLDTLRTFLANEFGQIAAREKPPSFCALRQDKALPLYDSPPAALRKVAANLYAETKPHTPPCNGASKAALNKGSAHKEASLGPGGTFSFNSP